MFKKLLTLVLIVVLLPAGIAAANNASQGREPEALPGTMATTWYVSTMGDDSNSCTSPSAPCASIQAAVDKAASGDMIRVATGVYTRLSGTELVTIQKSLSLSGGWNESFSTQNGISTLDGQSHRLCLNIYSDTTVSLSRFRLFNGNHPWKGGLVTYGTVLIQDSVIEQNNSGGIQNISPGDLTLIRTIVRANHGTINGGGIENKGALTLIQSAVVENNATQIGGGIYSNGTQVTIINSTISGNSAGYAAGIALDGQETASLYSSTIAHNVPHYSVGGIFDRFGETSIQNSIIAENQMGMQEDSAPDCFGTYSSGGYNLIGNTVGCTFNSSAGDLLDVNPELFLTPAYDGLLPTSPAVDGGDPMGCMDNLGSPLLVDQIGTTRPIDGNDDGSAVCDIGAIELDPDHLIRMSFLPITIKPCPVLYFDDFSNPNSGWPVGENNNAQVGYLNGEYRMLVKTANMYTVVRPNFQSTNIKITTDVRNATDVIGSYGIAFKIQPDWSGWYSLEIYPDGWFGIYRYDQYGGALLAEAYSPAIHQGTASNLLSVERNLGQITAYANGQQLASVYDNYFSSSGYVGLIDFAYNLPNVDARFDNFRVDPVDCQNGQANSEQIDGTSPAWLDITSINAQLANFSKHQP